MVNEERGLSKASSQNVIVPISAVVPKRAFVYETLPSLLALCSTARLHEHFGRYLNLNSLGENSVASQLSARVLGRQGFSFLRGWIFFSDFTAN